MSDPIELELPAAYLDEIIEDAVPAIADSTPVLINLDPESGEASIPGGTLITLDIATLAPAGTIDLSTVNVYVNGVLAFQAGTFQAGFDGPSSSYLNPQPDVLRIAIDPTVDFASQELVSVRVQAQASDLAGLLDATYSFTIADTTPPQITSAIAVELQRVRVVFSEDVNESALSVASALSVSDWTLDRLGDYLTPVVSAVVVGVEAVTTSSVDLVTDIPLTPGGNYRLTAGNLQDTQGNVIAAPFNTVDFTGWVPPAPAERDFDLYKRLPRINRGEDEAQDLFRFIGCFQEVLTLLLWDVDRFVEILDPDTAFESYIDAMLADLGNPFNFELSAIDKQRLVKVLVDMYRLKGTKPGIENVVRFFMGIEIDVLSFNTIAGTWALGEAELGIDTVLGTSDAALLYSFEVSVDLMLTDSQRKQLREIVEYMKPAHTHLVRILEPVVPTILDHLELGLSELGENWYLH